MTYSIAESSQTHPIIGFLTSFLGLESANQKDVSKNSVIVTESLEPQGDTTQKGLIQFEYLLSLLFQTNCFFPSIQ